MFAFRVTQSYSEFQKNSNDNFPEFYNCAGMLIYEHTPDGNEENVHIHGLILEPWYEKKGKRLDDTIERMRRAYFTKYYNKKYSLKVCDDNNKYMTYMSKGHLDPKFIYNLTDEHIKICKERWVDPKQINLKLVDGKLVRELGKNKLSKREIIDIMIADYNDSMNTEAIVRLIRKTLVKNHEVLGMYKVIDYYDALLMYANKNAFDALIISKINSRIRV
jgi:hypothetical protein